QVDDGQAPGGLEVQLGAGEDEALGIDEQAAGATGGGEVFLRAGQPCAGLAGGDADDERAGEIAFGTGGSHGGQALKLGGNGVDVQLEEAGGEIDAGDLDEPGFIEDGVLVQVDGLEAEVRVFVKRALDAL